MATRRSTTAMRVLTGGFALVFLLAGTEPVLAQCDAAKIGETEKCKDTVTTTATVVGVVERILTAEQPAEVERAQESSTPEAAQAPPATIVQESRILVPAAPEVAGVIGAVFGIGERVLAAEQPAEVEQAQEPSLPEAAQAPPATMAEGLQIEDICQSTECRLLFFLIQGLAERELACTTTVRMPGREASCPSGYVVTGCSAGENRGSIRHDGNRCVTDDLDTDWTEARCCRLSSP